LRQIERKTPPGLDLHLIVDNYATHKHPKVRSWLTRHPRFHMHFTPTSRRWSTGEPGHQRTEEVGQQPYFERRVTGRHQPYTMPTWKRAELSLARHEYRWTDVEELAQSSRQVCADLSLAGENS